MEVDTNALKMVKNSIKEKLVDRSKNKLAKSFYWIVLALFLSIRIDKIYEINSSFAPTVKSMWPNFGIAFKNALYNY